MSLDHGPSPCGGSGDNGPARAVLSGKECAALDRLVLPEDDTKPLTYLVDGQTRVYDYGIAGVMRYAEAIARRDLTADDRATFSVGSEGACDRCPYHLAWHPLDGRCPTEAEARERSGSQ